VTSAGLADTSVFIARESGRQLDISVLPDTLAVSIITVAELRAGVLAAADLITRDRRLATLQQALESHCAVAVSGQAKWGHSLASPAVQVEPDIAGGGRRGRGYGRGG
jgi:hypothetical protein